MESTRINWCDCTFNPWEGCTKVSPGCVNCYAAARDARHLTESVDHWGPGAPRRVTSDANWRQPLAWNRKAAAAGERLRVFCASLADVFDSEAPAGQRERLWQLIRTTLNLDWLLLTKRAENISGMLPEDWGDGYPNVWLGVTCESRRHGLARIDLLRSIPAVVRFLSCEPLLEDLGNVDLSGMDWVIIGGESGANARRFHLAWAESLIRQCRAQGVKPWVKQLGHFPIASAPVFLETVKIHGSADNWEEWSDTFSVLKVRELPMPRISLVEVA